MFDPVGPLALDGMDASRKSFFYNAAEILHVDHPNSNMLPVLALCSDQGEIYHLVATQVQSLDNSVKNLLNWRLKTMRLSDSHVHKLVSIDGR